MGWSQCLVKLWAGGGAGGDGVAWGQQGEGQEGDRGVCARLPCTLLAVPPFY